jgi:hypothetical protein
VPWHLKTEKEKFIMDKIIKKILTGATYLVFSFFTQCQMKEKPLEWHAEMCHPDSSAYYVTPVFDEIFTLEGIPASLPYGSSSGEWGDSHAMWTEQHGTPIGADITYLSHCENKIYRLQADFGAERMQEMVKRAYAWNDDLEYTGELKEYIYLRPGQESKAYAPFINLVFGFAPKGMVVVWLRYGPIVLEFGEFQAQEVTDPQKIKEAQTAYLEIYRLSEERFKEFEKEDYLPNADNKKWKGYRNRYLWRPLITSSNENFRLLESYTHYYNGEYEDMFRPWVLSPEMRKRAVPEMLQFFWETGKGKKYEARVFFDWETLNRLFASQTSSEIQVKVSEDSRSCEVLLNGDPLPTDIIRVYPNGKREYRDSYK